jgi:hypothetical protein
VALPLLAGAASATLVPALWPTPLPLPQRVRSHAWAELVPSLLEKKLLNPEDVAFLAALAQQMLAERATEAPRAVVAEVVQRVEAEVRAGRAPASHLALLCRLEAETVAASQLDPVPGVAERLANCFTGGLPLSFAERLLDRWQSGWWTAANQARLRVLLCDRAFEAGFEVANLLKAGESAPALALVLRCNAPGGLAALRLLWSLRPTCPWDRLGTCRTIFDLAADPTRTHLFAQPLDLLLWQEDPDGPVLLHHEGEATSVQIGLCPQGVWLRPVLFTEPPRVVEISSRPQQSELQLGQYRFRSESNLEGLAARMEKWFRYAFHEFRPALARVPTWQSPDRGAVLRALGAAPCPGCTRYLLARAGEVALALDEAAG